MLEAQSSGEFGQKLHDMVDRRFDQLYANDPARYAEMHQRAQAIVGNIRGNLSIGAEDNDPAITTLTRATTKLLLLFGTQESQESDPDTTNIFDFSVARFVNRIFANFDNLQAVADSADREANYLMVMVYQKNFAQEIGPAWEAMRPWDKIWFAGGMLAGRWPNIMQ